MFFLFVFLGLIPIPIPIFLSSVFADGRYADTDFLEPIFGADTPFAPSIYIIKMSIKTRAPEVHATALRSSMGLFFSPHNQFVELGFILWRSATQWSMCGKHWILCRHLRNINSLLYLAVLSSPLQNIVRYISVSTKSQFVITLLVKHC